MDAFAALVAALAPGAMFCLRCRFPMVEPVGPPLVLDITDFRPPPGEWAVWFAADLVRRGASGD
jgi:hypothetical protein